MLPGGFLGSIVVSIPACHAGDRGSNPRRGEFLFYFLQYSARLKSRTEKRYFVSVLFVTSPPPREWHTKKSIEETIRDNSNVFGNIQSVKNLNIWIDWPCFEQTAVLVFHVEAWLHFASECSAGLHHLKCVERLIQSSEFWSLHLTCHLWRPGVDSRQVGKLPLRNSCWLHFQRKRSNKLLIKRELLFGSSTISDQRTFSREFFFNEWNI